MPKGTPQEEQYINISRNGVDAHEKRIKWNPVEEKYKGPWSSAAVQTAVTKFQYAPIGHYDYWKYDESNMKFAELKYPLFLVGQPEDADDDTWVL